MTLDRFSFINRIIAMYPHAIKGEEGQAAYYDTYRRALGNPKIDFEKLFDIFSDEYKENFPPTANWLKEKSRACYKSEETFAPKYVCPKIYNPIYKTISSKDCFPSGTSEEQIIATFQKMFPNTEGWEVVGYV